MAREHVRVRLVEDIGIGRLLTDFLQQVEIRDQTTTARNYGAVILHLTRNEDVAPRTGRPIEDARYGFVFADAGVDDQAPQLTRAADHIAAEVASLDQALELARLRWIE